MLRLFSPSEAPFDAAQAELDYDLGFGAREIPAPEGGTWRLEVESSESAMEQVILVSSWLANAIKIEVDAEDVSPGQLELRAEVISPISYPQNAQIRTDWIAPSDATYSLPLTDIGGFTFPGSIPPEPGPGTTAPEFVVWGDDAAGPSPFGAARSTRWASSRRRTSRSRPRV